MKKLLLTLAAACLLASAAFAEKKEVHILSANDMHAKIENFPQLAAIADSLRALYGATAVFWGAAGTLAERVIAPGVEAVAVT